MTVFGGSRRGTDAAEYKQALQLGRLLVEAGFDVCSGGYAGIMEAISRGAHDAGGHVIGIAMTQFKSAPNPYLKKYQTRHGLVAASGKPSRQLTSSYHICNLEVTVNQSSFYKTTTFLSRF